MAFWSASGKDADDALNRLGRVNGVQRRKNHVPGLSGFERNFDRFLVAHLADQDHFGRLTQSGAQGQSEARRVTVQFALMNRGVLVRMQEFDRVFDRDDVIGLLFVDLVQDRGQCRRFAAPRWSGNEHDAIAQVVVSPSCTGRLSDLKSGIDLGMTRITMAQVPRCVKMLTRNRETLSAGCRKCRRSLFFQLLQARSNFGRSSRRRCARCLPA